MKIRRRSVVLLSAFVILACAAGVLFLLTFREHSIADAIQLKKGMTFDEITKALGEPNYPAHTTYDNFRTAVWELSDGFVRVLFDSQNKLVVVVTQPESTIPMLIRRVKWKFSWY